jgi:hypothetical protein
MNLGHSVEQTPGCSGLKLRMSRLTPFMEHVWNLGGGNRTRIQCSDHDVMSPLIINYCFIVAEDTLVKAVELGSQCIYGPCCQMLEVALSIACVLSCDLHLAAKREIITAEDFCACHQPRWEGLIMAVPYSYAPSPFKDTSAGQCDVQHTEVSLCIMAQGMSLFCHNEPRASELIMDFTKHPVV